MIFTEEEAKQINEAITAINRDAEAYHNLIGHLRAFAERPLSSEKEGIDDEPNDVYEMGWDDGETFLARMILKIYEGDPKWEPTTDLEN